jgi:hypothetical protein
VGRCMRRGKQDGQIILFVSTLSHGICQCARLGGFLPPGCVCRLRLRALTCVPVSAAQGAIHRSAYIYMYNIGCRGWWSFGSRSGFGSTWCRTSRTRRSLSLSLTLSLSLSLSLSLDLYHTWRPWRPWRPMCSVKYPNTVHGHGVHPKVRIYPAAYTAFTVHGLRPCR